MNPVYFYFTRYTRPYLPFPSSFILIKSSTDTFRGFGFDILKGRIGRSSVGLGF